MKRFSVLAGLLILMLLSWSCSKDNNSINSLQTESKGSIVLKFDPLSTPQSVSSVTAKLTRSAYETISAEMNLSTDSSAQLSLNGIAAGNWHLKVDAKNSSGAVEYSGETSVTIVANQVINVLLTLYPVEGGTGGINITVIWGGSRWMDYPGNPVLLASDNPTNPNGIRMCKVLYDNGVYKMWYAALYNSAVSNIWYAESHDGNNWHTVGTAPVLDKSSYGWDSYEVAPGAIIKDGGTFKMYYHGVPDHPYSVNWNMGLATSSDGIHWTKRASPVFQDFGNYYRAAFTSVVKVDSIYYAYFGYTNSTFTANYIGVAISSDGISWSVSSSNPIISANLTWENQGVAFPTVLYQSGKFLMYYNNDIQTALGSAESENGITFTKQNKPVFTIEQTYSNLTKIAYPNFFSANGLNRIYYTSESPDANYYGTIRYIYK